MQLYTFLSGSGSQGDYPLCLLELFHHVSAGSRQLVPEKGRVEKSAANLLFQNHKPLVKRVTKTYQIDLIDNLSLLKSFKVLPFGTGVIPWLVIYTVCVYQE